jgi:hypothetical protein
VGDHEEESSKIWYTSLENLVVKTIYTREKEIIEENQIHHEKDPTLPLDQQEPEVNHLEDPSPSMIPCQVLVDILVALEDDSQEESGEDLDLEVTQSSKVKKMG